MAFQVVLSRNAKVDGKRYKVGETVENVSEELFEELERRGLVQSHEEIKSKRAPKQTTVTEKE